MLIFDAIMLVVTILCQLFSHYLKSRAHVILEFIVLIFVILREVKVSVTGMQSWLRYIYAAFLTKNIMCRLQRNLLKPSTQTKAYVAQRDKRNSRSSPQFSKISLVNNFSFDPHQILMHHSWKVDDGRFIALLKLEFQWSIKPVRCSDIPKEKRLQFVTTQTKIKQQNSTKQSNDVHKNGHVSCLFKRYEERRVKKFLYQENLAKHPIIRRHERLLQRNSLRDTGIKIFASKDERIGHRELVSIVLENNTKSTNRKTQVSNMTEGWALPKVRKVTCLTPQQIDYSTRKFNDCIKHNTRWNLKPVTAEMESLNEKNIFAFNTSKLLSGNQSRSYFSRLESSQQKSVQIDECNEHNIQAFKEEQLIGEVIQRRQLQHKIHSMDQVDRTSSPKRANSSSEISVEWHSMRPK